MGWAGGSIAWSTVGISAKFMLRSRAAVAAEAEGESMSIRYG